VFPNPRMCQRCRQLIPMSSRRWYCDFCRVVLNRERCAHTYRQRTGKPDLPRFHGNYAYQRFEDELHRAWAELERIASWGGPGNVRSSLSISVRWRGRSW